MKKTQVKEGSIVKWQDIKSQQLMKGLVIKFYTNSALVDISIMPGYQELELGEFTVVNKTRMSVTK